MFTAKSEQKLYCTFAKFIGPSIHSVNCSLPFCGPNEKNPFLTGIHHCGADVTIEMK